jgi:elongation factor 2
MGRKEENIRKAQALMHQPKKIRNIGTAAHIDHGKCVAGSARILVNGSWTRAGALFEEMSDNPVLVRRGGMEVLDVSGKTLNTVSLDRESLRVRERRITRIWRLPATEPLCRVELRDGSRIEVTPEHKFMAFGDGEVRDVEARDLSPGDYVVVPRWLPVPETSCIGWREFQAILLRLLGEDKSLLAYVSEDLTTRLMKLAPVKDLWRRHGHPWSYKALLDSFKHRRFRLHVLVDVAQANGVSLTDLYDGIECLRERAPTGGASAGAFLLPGQDQLSDFLWYVGLVFGDGCTNGYFHNSNRELMEKAVQVIRRHCPTASVRRYRNGVPRLEHGSRTFLRVLRVAFRYPRVRKARNLRFPQYLHRLDPGWIAAFVRGYLDADGSVEEGRRAVTASSSSLPFLEDFHLLLLRLGIRGVLSPRGSRIAISGRANLGSLPGFEHPTKSKSFQRLLSRAGPSHVVDLVPIPLEDLASVSHHARDHLQMGETPSILSLPALSDGGTLAIGRYLHGETCFVQVVSISRTEAEWVYDFSVPRDRNFTAEGIFIHNTTMSDSLIAGAGMMSEELAGRQLLLDYDEQEQARGITINAANASMVHEHQGEQYLINLIDTPGHVDFGGDVTRAMRAIDGVIIVDDAVEGVMPQTETVIRQALKEKVKPTLFVNKVDRLINELQVGPDEMQQRLLRIISEVNTRILKLVPEEFRDEWQVRVDDGTVAFGSALYTWAISVPFMESTGITFKDIYEYLKGGDQKGLAKVAPLHKVLLDMVIRHLPDPVTAQAYRIPHIWRGDINSPIGKAMVNCDENGPVALMITKIIMDPHAGEVAVGRLFSGRISRGQELYIVGMPKPYRVQQVALSVGADRIAVDEINAGNIVSLTGLKDAVSGSTVSSERDMESFERIVHYSEPVVTVAIEAKHTKDLPKLVDVLRTIAKADPSIQVEIDQETGEHLMSGMGELHLEITQYRIVNEHKVEITASEPIVVYRESISGMGSAFEGKSPNKHNRFYLQAVPLEDAVVEAIKSGEIRSGERIKNRTQLARQLQDLGMSKVESKGIVWIEGPNILTDVTKGIQYLHETMDLIKEAYIEAMNKGPLAQEKCVGVKIRLVDAKLHEDSIHRGPAQVIPAVRRAIYGSMCQAGRILLEPKQKVVLNLPQDLMGAAISEVQSRRAVVEDIVQEGELTIINAKAPVAEMFGFATAIRSATQGRALWSYENAGFERLPKELQPEVVREIRTRKGLKPEPYDEAYYAS